MSEKTPGQYPRQEKIMELPVGTIVVFTKGTDPKSNIKELGDAFHEISCHEATRLQPSQKFWI